MRIITKLQILCIVLSCAALISCSEDDGTGIQEVDVTRNLLLGEWNLETLKVGKGSKSATITETTNVLSADGVTFETKQFTEYKFTLNNTGGDYGINFFDDSTLGETDKFDDSNETVLATLEGDRLFEEEEDGATVLEYQSAFFDNALNVTNIRWEIADKNTIIIRGTASDGAEVSTTLDVFFFSDSSMRLSYELSNSSPFFGSDALTLLEQGTLTIEDGFTLVGDLLRPSSGTVFMTFNK
ncbi:hypothetical protein [Aquimarina algiphila]|uniref:hypothetical protein n=1 Tax=Aquimarina algiphila TaxID=2047982 RepID=UPI00232A89D9|nr:hypothetical protein [Aquimarina algiphila]